MHNDELAAIATAMQDSIHRAYALGRNDALRRVVEMVQTDELSSKAMVLLPSPEATAVPAPEHTSAAAEAAAPIMSEGPTPARPAPAANSTPWWRRKVA